VIVSLNIDPLRNAKGELVGAVNCFIDITERKRTAAALEHSRQHALEQEQRLAATYEHAAIGISEIAPDGSFLRVNEAICAITGYSREHLLANRLFAHTHADDADVDREAFRKQIGGELEFYSVEKRLNRSDGRQSGCRCARHRCAPPTDNCATWCASCRTSPNARPWSSARSC
jgi:PAS domain S-box-containing protein